MSVLPEGWAAAQLGELLEFKYGKSLPEKSRADGDHPVYGSNGIVGTHNESITSAPVIVIGRKGSIGKVHFTERACFPIDTTYYIDGFGGVDAHFAKLLLRSLPLCEMNRATAIPGLNREDAYSLNIAVPPLPEQRRIVAKIDSLSTKSARARDRLDHIPRLVEKYKQAILAAAFRGDMTREWRLSQVVHKDAPAYVSQRQLEHASRQLERNWGRDEKTAQITPDRDVEEQLVVLKEAEPLPATWCWTTIGLIFGVYVGATPSRKEPRFWNGTIRWVSSGEVAFCRIRETTETITDFGLRETSTRLHPPGTLLIGMIGEGKTRGQVAILETKAANNQNCAAIRVSEAGYDVDYVYWHLWMSYAQTRAIGSGNNQQALNKERVQHLRLPLAPPVEAMEIASRINKLFNWIDRLAKEATSARKLIDHLDQAVLAKAFRGELVPQDPSDEAATVLLQRIKAEQAGYAPIAARRGRKPRQST